MTSFLIGFFATGFGFILGIVGICYVVSTEVYDDGRIHIGVDAWNYKPVSERELESILAKMKK